MSHKRQISLCILTENNKGYPPNCLDLMRDYVNEIIVVGIMKAENSSKSSIEDAIEAKGVSFHQVKWENSYSKIKNYCLELAKGDWILFLEGNEMISPTELSKLKTLVANPNAEGYILNIDNTLYNQRLVSPLEGLRLIRARREYRFHYRAYEIIPEEDISNILEANIYITPIKRAYQMRDETKLVRLLEEDLREFPEDCYLRYIKGINLLSNNSYEAAVEELKAVYGTLNKDYLFTQHLYKSLSWVLTALNRDSEALALLEESIANYPFNTDLLILRGELRKKQKLYGEALADLESALKLREQSLNMQIKPVMTTSTIYELMGDTHREIFNLPQALLCYREAYELNKYNYRLLYKIGALTEDTDNVDILIELMEAVINHRDSQGIMILVDILFHQRKFNEAIKYLNALENIIGENENIEVLKYLCYSWLGKKEEAEEICSRTKLEGAMKNQLLLQKIEDLWLEGLWQSAEELLGSIEPTEELRELYDGIHQLFKCNTPYNQKLAADEYESVFLLQKRLLWFHQTERAEMLLPLLLRDIDEDKGIKLAKLWVEYYDFNVIEGIYNSIKGSDRREFIKAIILLLLKNNRIDAALRLQEVGASEVFEPIAAVIDSRVFMSKLNSRMVRLRQNMNPVTSTASFKKRNLPSGELLDFYMGLSQYHTKNKKADSLSLEALTTERVHVLIGDSYSSQQKWREALVGYIRGLQWNPYDRAATDRLTKICRDHEFSIEEVHNSSCRLEESEYFSDTEEFRFFTEGLLYLKDLDYDEALDVFEKASFSAKGYNPARLYILAILWFTSKEEKAAQIWKETEDREQIIDTIFDIYCDLQRDRLKEVQKQYPYSNLIAQEIDSINHRCSL